MLPLEQRKKSLAFSLTLGKRESYGMNFSLEVTRNGPRL